MTFPDDVSIYASFKKSIKRKKFTNYPHIGVGDSIRTPWTARRSDQSILKEISPEYSLEGLMLKLKLQYFGHLMRRTDSLEKTLRLEKMNPFPATASQDKSHVKKWRSKRYLAPLMQEAS